ncbi:MSMEG_0565 family glycosyltransferase [Leptolyngbya sp. FACHB-711]|uniref:MSMEG_0565 family glycosyltransferase n=1 Tax=Leptolyngbya sp. FACHB-711 TaxID=2692813 RepID=UPI0016850708|nr:MSMEG_0565 family glycosyltransferase [Leptolyngbya sp. FACHB-711]MBD2023426.1 MSMEG_0565 family glycosyltransferase [Leptolyngbya sp. FACHB-711]
MRIALFTYSTKPRGSVIHTLELAEALHQQGHQLCVYALDKDGRGFDYFVGGTASPRSLACRYQPVPAGTAPPEIDRLIQQRIQEFVDFLEHHLQSENYDIFHAQDCISANALAALRQRGLVHSFVRTVHHIEDYNSPYLQHCQERSIREPDLCFCVSDYWQQQLLQQYGIHAPRVINGVNCDRFTPVSSAQDLQLKQQLQITGHPVFLTVGGIEPRKNTLQLVKAFARVQKSLPKAQLVIAGGATLFDYQSYRDEFFALVHELELELDRSILLPGVIADEHLPCLYRCADAFVFPSVKEGWGLVVLEALASGLPTIVSDHAPFTEFLNSQQTLFAAPDHPASIAQAMLKSIQPDVSQALRQNSRSVVETYSWKTSAMMHLDHYQALLSSIMRSASFN